MNKLEYDKYIDEQELRREKGYLTRSERELLKKMIDNPKDYIKEDVYIKGKTGETGMQGSLGKYIIMDRTILSQASAIVTPEDDIKGIIRDLKDTLAGKVGALGLSAPQIGIKKRICYISIPSINKENKSIDYKELILVNPVIIEASNPIRVNGEGCCSFMNIRLNTSRYIYITVEYLDENLKTQVTALQDLESFAIQHECDHLNGITIFDRKWKTK